MCGARTSALLPRAGNLAGFSAHQNPPRTIHSVVRRMGTPESCSRPEPAPPGGQTSALSQTAVSAIRGLRESANCNPTTAEERTAQRAPGTERLAPKNSAADHRFTKSVNSSSQQISAVGAQHSQRTKKKPPLSQAEPPSKMLGPSGEFVELRVSGVRRLQRDLLPSRRRPAAPSDAPRRRPTVGRPRTPAPHTGTSCRSTSCGRD